MTSDARNVYVATFVNKTKANKKQSLLIIDNNFTPCQKYSYTQLEWLNWLLFMNWHIEIGSII